MSSLRELQWRPAPSSFRRLARRLVAVLLEKTSTLLARLASRLESESERESVEPRVEFHAEAGAPEGALYVDGRFVGWLPGVSRL